MGNPQLKPAAEIADELQTDLNIAKQTIRRWELAAGEVQWMLAAVDKRLDGLGVDARGYCRTRLEQCAALLDNAACRNTKTPSPPNGRPEASADGRRIFGAER